jgi:DNA-binding beta-propeller fold protein YncE
LALVLFSWAGEKMPWLLLHVALPLLLLASLALDRFVRWMAKTRHTLWRSADWLIAPLFLLLALALTGLVRLLNGQVPHPLAGQYLNLQAGVLAIICLGLIALLAWRIYRIDGRHLGQSFATLGLLLLSLYTVRSTFLVNFYNGDTPVEMLVYTQTAPDVPLVVQQIEQLGIDHTRQTRTVADPTGGHGLQVAIDNSRGAALEWPFRWYLRDFDRAGTLSIFNGTQGAPPEADILLVLADNQSLLEPYLQGQYTGMRLKHRWWFPEFETYKRWTLTRSDRTPLGFETMPWLVPSTYSREGVINLWNYFTFRKLPYELGSQDFYLYIRSELLPAGGATASTDPYIEKLTSRQATQSWDGAATATGRLSYPHGIAVDTAGTIFVADSGNNRIVAGNTSGDGFSWGSFCNLTTEAKEGCMDPDGTGPLPLGAGQFNEPWGVAVDATRGWVYVADTWNHRIQAFDTTGQFLGQWGDGILVDADFAPGGRPDTPYGFYGPRGVAVDNEGRVYVTDTGNERVLIYEVVEVNGQLQVSYLSQIGTMGPDLGQFLEPVGIAVDATGWVYVADTLNGRVQVFAPSSPGTLASYPVANWPVTGWDSTSRENKPYIAVGPGGQIYFSVPERHYLASTDSTGKVLTVWGGSGSDLAAFNMPIGVAVDAQGQVYVSDSGNGRVLVFAMP